MQLCCNNIFAGLFGMLPNVNVYLFYQKQTAMTATKVYNNFSDKFGNKYSFATYAEFAMFWFNLSRKAAMSFFPANFSELQNAAANSKEARKKVEI